MPSPEKQKPAPRERDGLLIGVLLDGEPSDHTPNAPGIARVMLRSLFNDDGHFQGLEVLS